MRTSKGKDIRTNGKDQAKERGWKQGHVGRDPCSGDTDGVSPDG